MRYTLDDLPNPKLEHTLEVLRNAHYIASKRLERAQKRHSFLAVQWALHNHNDSYNEMCDIIYFMGSVLAYIVAYEHRINSITETTITYEY